jgi:nitrogen fixation NifU-like protein
MGVTVSETLQSLSNNTLEGLSGLYKEIIVEHAKHPRRKGRPASCRFCQDGKNPLCGDQITVFCEVESSTTGVSLPCLRVGFDGSGCSISQASASMMCESVSDKSVPEIRKIMEKAECVYTGKCAAAAPDDIEDDIDALAGVAKFPVRVKCAALAWKSLELLLNEHFDSEGRIKANDVGCDSPVCGKTKRIKIISTESN